MRTAGKREGHVRLLLFLSPVLKYIERCCLSNLTISDDILEVWQSIINDNLPHTVESIRVSVILV